MEETNAIIIQKIVETQDDKERYIQTLRPGITAASVLFNQFENTITDSLDTILSGAEKLIEPRRPTGQKLSETKKMNQANILTQALTDICIALSNIGEKINDIRIERNKFSN